MTVQPLDAVLRPVTDAHGLPNAHYTSAEIFAEEREHVLFANWAGIGFGKDVPEPGCVAPVDFLGMPLLMVRDDDGAVRVFQNTCRHRGMILVKQAQKLRGAIRCPYHSWCYTLQGRLRTTPHVGGPGRNIHEGVDRGALGLIPIRSYVWRDVVFVNISGTAPEFEDAHAALIARWGDFDQPMYHGGAGSSFQLHVRTNWKLAVENYCESYHLPWVHPGLNSYSRLQDHYHIEAPGQFSGQGTMVYRQLTGADGAMFPDFAGLDSKWDTGAEYVALYPNVLFGVHRDHAFAILLEAVDHQNTVEHVELYYPTPPDALPDGLAEQNATLWKGVFEEDIFVVEGMQRGRSGMFFDGGKFSPAMDGPTHLFHQWVATQMLAGQAAAG